MKHCLLLLILLGYIVSVLAGYTSIPVSSKIASLPPNIKLLQVIKSIGLISIETFQEIYGILTDIENEREDSAFDFKIKYNTVLQFLNNTHPTIVPLVELNYKLGIHDFPESGGYHNHENFFVLNNRKYFQADDLFYLKTKELKSALLSEIEPKRGEIPIGTDANAPIIYFYGCDEDEDFYEFNYNLWSESQGGKIQYIWRYTCGSIEYAELGANLDLSLKLDDLEDRKTLLDFVAQDSNLTRISITNKYNNDMKLLDLQTVSLIFEDYQINGDFWKAFDYAKDIIYNLPLKTNDLVNTNIDPYIELIQKEMEENEKKGLDYGMLGCYINGMQLRYSELNINSFIKSIIREWGFIKKLKKTCSESLALKTFQIKNLLTTYSLISLPYLQSSQPLKFDVTDINNEDLIVYFNDLESDQIYNDVLSKDIISFFEESPYGELPAYSENWSELIFLIDFDDENSIDILRGMLRVIEVVKNGYPQRVGLIPMGDCRIVSEIYRHKSDDLEELIDFFQNIHVNKKKFSANTTLCEELDVFLQNVAINGNSFIINGEIYPFRQNSWNYLVNKVIVKDTTFLRKEIKRYLHQSLDEVVTARKLLHSDSQPFKRRDLKYTPDYFGDSTYTTENVKAITGLQGRILVIVPNLEYNILNTLTLVDNFDSCESWKFLCNFLNLKLYGIRIRLIHNGSTKSKYWKQLLDLFFDGVPSIETFQKSMPKIRNIKRSYKNIENANYIKSMRKFLPDLPDSQITAQRFLLLNGKYIKLDMDEIPSSQTIKNLLKRESKRTLNVIIALEQIVPNYSENLIEPDFVEQLSSILTKSFFDDYLNQNGIYFTSESSLPRLALSKILGFKNKLMSFEEVNYPTVKPVDITLLLDPTEERTQKMLSLVSMVRSLSFVNVQLYFLPTKELQLYPVERIYYDNIGEFSSVSIDNDIFEAKLEYLLPNLHVIKELDLNIISEIWVEANVYNIPPNRNIVESDVSGMCLNVIRRSSNKNDTVISQFINMRTFGYGSFKLPMDAYYDEYYVKSCSPEYKVKAFGLDIKADFSGWDSFNLNDVLNNNNRIYIEVTNETYPSLGNSLSTNNTNKINMVMNIFDKRYEDEFFQFMEYLLHRNNQHIYDIKIWILDHQGISVAFKSKLSQFMKAKGPMLFEYEFVSYHWPSWMRPEKYLHRELDLARVLLLDVILPLDIEACIYIDIIKIKNWNLIEQVALNYDKSYSNASGIIYLVPYPEIEYGYWKTGYWEKYLDKNDLLFYQTDFVMVNMTNFRKAEAGDKLRVHYQRLSSDIFSLRNVAQDLINNIQLQVPITSLNKFSTMPSEEKNKLNDFPTNDEL
ncbi:uncharacterized protein SCODWIG_00664 [Saccharomycodes ludwigii]|uniref:Killer toxin-resistance protein 5 n=1 Tax=Saccharomycodes ludwigii TaxID=36035 RepID=A0A376B2K2_9ASCO|nr:hypothetical protein SCDLUD_000460 [Saccharomycodes ludwigii]KAH3902866.1 hypothetical protein SCDLUD_000460 [Saccharomycodes ludwigii]SSD58903.1 uncharacterized protein SCODWIG_00664 [Saccharomycodes ludwigii]